MARRDEILGCHREAIRSAATRNKATSIALVGSVARGSDGPDSDVDFVCEWAPDASLFDASGLLAELEELLGCSVEISSARMLVPPYTSMLDDAIRL
ncbi:nucleotidyltransferase family protein [Candidatus Poriferisodalis sp.]|uniref:nucleotidyltransferase family protein n=1 Tax=Candidatus Poriferisodalis sp. TaxID=3101277 RepID=UPI003C6F9324